MRHWLFPAVLRLLFVCMAFLPLGEAIGASAPSAVSAAAPAAAASHEAQPAEHEAPAPQWVAALDAEAAADVPDVIGFTSAIDARIVPLASHPGTGGAQFPAQPPRALQRPPDLR